MKYIDRSNIGYTQEPGIYENSDNIFMSKNLLPSEVKIDITIDDITLKSNLTTNKSTRLAKRSFFIRY